MPTPMEQIFSALAEIRARLASVPPPGDKEKNELKTAFDELIAKGDAINTDETDQAAKKVGAAAEELEAVVKSGRTDPIDIFVAALRKAIAKLESTSPTAQNLAPSGKTPKKTGDAAFAAVARNGLTTDTQGAGMALPLTQAGLETACQTVGVKAAEIWSIVYTETDPPNCGFLADGRPQILFERHIFHRLTEGAFSNSHPSISSADPGNYGSSGAYQYQRLAEAMSLNESAALQSASWGIGQTLGTNYKTVGFASPQELVRQMFYSEDQQLLAAVREIAASGIATALAAHDWKAFASKYNGPTYWKHNYDQHLQSWYVKLSSGALPDLNVRTAQVYLMYLGYDSTTIDGIWGKRTASAWNKFQSQRRLPLSDHVDSQTMSMLVTEAQKANAKLPGLV